MKALTICQPYAALILRGDKRVENRDWPTRYRGPLAIHAGKSRAWLDDEDEAGFAAAGERLAFGAIVGVARLVDVVRIETIDAGTLDTEHPWLRSHLHALGPWCWLLDDVRRLARPVPWKGALGLWDVDSSALEASHA